MEDLLKKISGFEGRIAILTHVNADLDALGSSIALKRYLKTIAPKSEITIVVPGGPSAYGRPLLDALFEETESGIDSPADYLFILDTPTLDQVKPVNPEKSGNFIAVIDHHVPHPDTRAIADFYLVDETASSTSEILYPYLERHVTQDNEAALALLCGIMADSGGLRFASNGTIHVLSRLLDASGLDLHDADGFLKVPDDISRRIAHLKAAQRMNYHRADPWLIATSRVNAFGSSATMQLLHLGADCALVASKDDDELRIHGRAKRGFIKETGINLGADIMPEVGKLLGGSGGGHAGAAAAKGQEGDLEEVLTRALELILRELEGS